MQKPRSVCTGGVLESSVVLRFDLLSSGPGRCMGCNAYYTYDAYYRYCTAGNDERCRSHRESDKRSESRYVKSSHDRSVKSVNRNPD